MLPPNDISSLLSLMVTGDNSFQYQNTVCEIAHKTGKTLDNWLHFYLSERRVLAEAAGCQSYFELTLIMERDVYEVVVIEI